MERKKMKHYLRFFSLKYYFSQERTKRDILVGILVLISLRVAIFGVMSLTGFHLMSYLPNF